MMAETRLGYLEQINSSEDLQSQSIAAIFLLQPKKTPSHDEEEVETEFFSVNLILVSRIFLAQG
jgi:hypothetical protein